MLFDRRPFYRIGLVVGLGIVAFFWFGPKTSPEQHVARDVAILAKEPWDSVRVLEIQFDGSESRPSDVLVRGARPNGTPVLVHFAADSPYTARSAVERLRSQDVDRVAEILMVPRSLVVPKFRERFRREATHAGIAYFGGPPPIPTAEAATDEETPPGTGTAPRATNDG